MTEEEEHTPKSAEHKRKRYQYLKPGDVVIIEFVVGEREMNRKMFIIVDDDMKGLGVSNGYFEALRALVFEYNNKGKLIRSKMEIAYDNIPWSEYLIDNIKTK